MLGSCIVHILARVRHLKNKSLFVKQLTDNVLNSLGRKLLILLQRNTVSALKGSRLYTWVERSSCWLSVLLISWPNSIALLTTTLCAYTLPLPLEVSALHDAISAEFVGMQYHEIGRK